MTPTRPRTYRRRAGLTLIEMMLALACTAMISTAIASMLFAVSRGTASSSDLRGLVLQHQTVRGRLDASVRSSARVLASGADYLVLWMADSRADGLPNLSELRRIEYDAGGHALRSYKASFPAGWTQAQIDAADTAYPLDSDFNSITTSLKSGGYFPGEAWSHAVYGATFTLDHATPQSAALVSYRLTVRSGDQSAAVIGAAALRRP